MSNTLLNKAFSYTAVCIAFLFAFNFDNAFWLFNPDKCSQILAAQSLTNGDGYQSCQAIYTDLSIDKCQFLIGFPPGYSWMANFFHLFMHNYVKIDVAINILALLLYFTALFMLLKKAGIKDLFIALFFLWHAFSSSIIQTLGTPDLISLTLLLWTFVLAIRLFEIPRSILVVLAIGLLTGFNCVVKYSYYPMIAVMPLTLAALAYFKGSRRMFINSGLALLMSLIVLGGQSVYLKSNAGKAAHVSYNKEDAKSLHFDNLKKIEPFSAYALFENPFKFHVIPSKLKAMGFSLSFGIQRVILFTLSFIITILSFFIIFKLLWKKKSEFRLICLIALMLGFTILVNAGSMKALSLLIAPLETYNNWTYVQEYRYFAPSMLAFVLLLMIGYQTLESRLARYLSLGLLTAALLYSAPDKLYKMVAYDLAENTFNTKVIQEVKPTGADQFEWDDFKSVLNSDEKRVVFSQKGFISDIYALQGAAICRQYDEIVQDKFSYSAPLELILRMPDEKSEAEKAFIEKYDAQPILELKKEKLYKVVLN